MISKFIFGKVSSRKFLIAFLICCVSFLYRFFDLISSDNLTEILKSVAKYYFIANVGYEAISPLKSIADKFKPKMKVP